MPEETTKQVATVEPLKGKTVISFTQPTPMWANWVFRIQFLANKAFLLAISTDAIFPDINIKKAVAIASVIDFMVWGIGRGIGVKKQDFEEE